jgi:formate dehydrogenase maturation protein FdhE
MTITPEADVTVKCAKCGNELDGDGDMARNGYVITIEFCPTCEKAMKDEIEDRDGIISDFENQVASLEDEIEALKVALTYEKLKSNGKTSTSNNDKKG